MQACGALQGSTALTRARRLLESEAALARECAAPELTRLLDVCRLFHGSPAVQRARGMLAQQSELAAALAGDACVTVRPPAPSGRTAPAGESLDKRSESLDEPHTRGARRRTSYAS